MANPSAPQDMPASDDALCTREGAAHPTLASLQQGPGQRHLLHNLSGARALWLAFGLLRQEPTLREAALWPAVINICACMIGIFTAVMTWGNVLSALWTQPQAPVLALLWNFVWALGLIIAIILSCAIALMFAGIVASPFNDRLSQKTEQLVLGADYVEPAQLGMAAEMTRSIRSTALITATYMGCMAPLLLLNLIPGVGSVAYTVCAGGVSAYFIALEYCDILLARHHLPTRDKFALIWRERQLTLSFGASASLMLAIPLLNMLLAPLAVIGGTLIGITLRQRLAAHPRLLKSNAPPQLTR